MLSAFTARPIIELRQQNKAKIETILAHGDRIFVGLNTGALRVYRLNELTPSQNNTAETQDDDAASPPRNGDRPTSKALPPTELLREEERFSTRAIEQLAVIKEANTIVSLSNYHVSLHDIKTYQLNETLSRSKNATCFAVTSNVVNDPDTAIPEIISRLAVAVKRRLLLWSWPGLELGEEAEEVVLSESIRTVTWASATKLVCGMNGGYVMVDALTHEVQDIVSPGAVGTNTQGSRFGAMSSAGMGYMGLGGYVPKPLSAKLAEGEMLLAKDINTLFINDKGEALDRKQMPWAASPESIGYSYPYIVALQPPSKGSLEVRNPDTLSLLQTISLPGAAQLHFAPPSTSVAHAGKGFHILSDRCVWKMDATDYDSQVKELVEGASYDEAVSILNMLEDALLSNKTETLREIKMQKAEMLFKKKKFQQSMDLFNEDDVHAPPERVLKLFPPEIAGEYSGWLKGEDGGEDKPAYETPAKKSNGTRPSSPTGKAEPSSPQHVGGFAKMFRASHRKTASDAASIAPVVKEAPDNGDAESVKETSPIDDKPLDGKNLTKAVSELSGFLVGTRSRLQRVIDPATGKLKPQSDSKGSPEEIAERFLRTTQNDSEKQLEESLRETFKMVDTALFKAYMFAKPYLVGSLFRIPNFCDPEVVNEKLLENNRYTELIDFFYGKKLHKEALNLLRRFGSAEVPDEAAPSLHGADRTIQYLQNLPPTEADLILEHAKWTLKASPKHAMEIFIGDTENAETLPSDRIVAFLHDIDPQFEGRYLEHVVNELNDMTPELHDRLVELYVQNLKQMSRGDEWFELMGRFVEFLRESKEVYGLGKALGLIPKDDAGFFEAQAVVLSKMGKHREALQLYVFEMKDYAKAEEYCNRVHKSTDTTLVSPLHREDDKAADDNDKKETTPSIYHTLLSLYLKPPASKKPLLAPALDLLSKHGSRLPALSTLGLIPEDLPVKDLESYFRGRIRSTNSLVYESRIVAAMRNAESMSVAARLHLGDGEDGAQGGRNRHVTITEERHCVVCHKKLAGGMRIGGSVVAVLPDNTVVHYGCLGRATGQKIDLPPRAPSWSRGF